MPRLHNLAKYFHPSVQSVFFVLVAIVAAISSVFAMPPSGASASTASCGNVNSPLPSWLMQEVNNNKPFYLNASSRTGVPWEMLAAIHYRETTFSHTNPANGQGIFQFVNGNGGPYPPGPVSDAEFVRQLTYMANTIQEDYVYRNYPNPDPIQHRRLTANETNYALVQSTLYSYNGRSSAYAKEAEETYGYNRAIYPYEGSPYVMNMFDCNRSSMGLITKDYGDVDGTDYRYGAFTLYARLKGDTYWKDLQSRISRDTPFFQIAGSTKTYIYGAGNSYYSIDDYQRLRDYGFENRFGSRTTVVSPGSVSGLTNKGSLPGAARFEAAGVFIMNSGTKHPFPSEEIFQAYGYNFGVEAALPSWVGTRLPENIPVQQVAKAPNNNGGTTVYFVNSGRKQPICNVDAFTKLGSPVYSSRPSTTLGAYYMGRVQDGAPIAMQGDLIESWDTGQYGVWQSGLYYPMDPGIARATGLVSCGTSATSVSHLTKSGVPINNLVKNARGDIYVIDRNRKLYVSPTTLSAYALNANNAIQLYDGFLDKLSQDTLPTLVRVNNGLGVYSIRSGKSYGIPSEADLYGLGYSFAQVKNIAQTTQRLVPDGGILYAPGRVIREQSQIGVYLLDGGFVKHPFTTEDELYAHGYSWRDVAVIPNGASKAYSEGLKAGYFVREDDGNYWYLDRGVKRRVQNTLPTAAGFGLTTQSITTLPASMLSRLPMSTPLTSVFRAQNSNGVYLIENGKKRVFASEAALKANGYTWSDVRVLSPGFVQTIPEGAPIF